MATRKRLAMSKIQFKKKLEQPTEQPQESGHYAEKQQSNFDAANALFYAGKERFEDLMNEARCIADLIDGHVYEEVRLSGSGAMGLSSILRRFHDQGWEIQAQLSEAWESLKGARHE